MNIKSVKLPLMVWMATAAVSPVHAQNAGFQIGQPQPAQPQSPPAPSTTSLIAPITSPIQPTANPILPLMGTNSLQQVRPAPQVFSGFGNGAIPVLPAGGIIFVPAGTLVIESGIGMEPGTFLAAPHVPPVPPSPGVPSGGRGGGTAIDRSNRSTNIGQQASSPDVTRLALGTSRDKVIEKYGNPIAFVMNMNGETLYFRDGVVVFVKDGVVATPVIPGSATRP